MVKAVRKAILTLILFMLLASIAGCRSKAEDYRATNQDRIILRLAESQPASYPSSWAAQEFSRLVEQRSAGRIKVKVYDSGTLGDETSVIEQVQFGGIDLARVSAASLAKYSPKLRIVSLPYLFQSPAHMWKLFDGPFGEAVKESLLKEKITCLAWYEGGARGFYHSQKRIKGIEDLKGSKISVPQSQPIIDLYSSIGISLVPTKSSDVYSALQTGNIDGAEDNIVAYYAARHYEVAPYFTYDEHARIPEAIIGSRVTMLQLTKNDQAIIEQAARESAGLQRQKWLATEAEVFKALNARGLLILWGDYESRERFLSAARSVYDSFGRAEFEALAESRER